MGRVAGMGVREGLLALLSGGPRHGYGLKTEFERRTGGVWPLNVGQVYTTLERLERDGLVEPADGESDGQRAWRLTDRGGDELARWWEAVPGQQPPPRDELVLKVLLAVPAGPAHVLEVIDRQREALLGLLARRRRAAAVGHAPGAAGEVGGPLAAELAAEVLVLRTEADLRWLDVCEERVVEAGVAGDEDESAGRRPVGREGRT